MSKHLHHLKFCEQNLCKTVCDFCPNFNRVKLTYSIKYTFTVQFEKKECSYVVTILGEPKFTPKGQQITARIVTSSDITIKQGMFRTKLYASP